MVIYNSYPVDMKSLYVASCFVLLHAMFRTRTAGEPGEFGAGQSRHGQEQVKHILEGGNMGVLCNSSGHPGKNIYWGKVDSSFRVDGHELLIRNIGRANDGMYICHATDGTTSESINYVYIDVLYSAKILMGISPHDKLYPNDTYYVTVKIEGNPAPSNLMVSLTSGEVIYKQENYGLLNITIVSVQCSDTGIYQLHSVNRFASDSITKNITVFCAPYVNPGVTTEFNITPRLGDVATLVMHAAGYPQPNYTWWNNDKRLNQTSDGYTSTVTIGDVAVQNYGTYILEMANSIGMHNYSFHVRPTGPPDPPTNLTLLTHTSHSATLRWITGYDYSDRQTFLIWQSENGTYIELETFLDSPIDDGQKEIICTINQLQSNQAYKITVTTQNTNGESVRNGESVSFYTKETTSSVTLVVTILAVVFVLCVIGFITYRRYRNQTNHDIIEEQNNEGIVDSDSGDDDDEMTAMLQEIERMKKQKQELKKERLRQTLQKATKDIHDLIDSTATGTEETDNDEVSGRKPNAARGYGSINTQMM